MSSLSWQTWREQLSAAITRLRKADLSPRIAILGIGNEFRGDDAAGVRIVRQLSARFSAPSDVLLLDAGVAPENFSGPLRRFGPGLVLLVDAAQMGAAPGEIRWLAWQETEGVTSSTHTLPPSVLAQYLVSELGCEVFLLGIQPSDLDFDAPLTPRVEAAVAEIVQVFELLLD